MGYKYSQIDKSNLGWFQNDASRQTLLAFKIREGEIRGLKNLQIDFKYPITAIAGKNKSGKSTVLAITACAFHNTSRGFKQEGRNQSYFTFSDFFIQTDEEIPPDGVKISYKILHNNWKKSTRFPDGIGAGFQDRYKKKGGKWNKYKGRVIRNVLFFGVNRVVPHVEKSTSRSYRNTFVLEKEASWVTDVKERVSRILDCKYENFSYKAYSKYRLPIVTQNQITYSGFNMGAGENALFELFSIIYSCPEGALILIDEIELGLHAQAQERLIIELKNICLVRKNQIICTTHSPIILGCLPPEGRILIEKTRSTTNIIEGISPEYAVGKLSGKPSAEITVFLEDDVAKSIVEESITSDLRARCEICPIGSAMAIIRALSLQYKMRTPKKTCAILDGDQRRQKNALLRNFFDAIESSVDKDKAKLWFEERVFFLPGDTSPELWIISTCKNKSIMDSLSKDFRLPVENLEDFLESVDMNDHHNEFETLSRKLCKSKSCVQETLINYAAVCSDPSFPIKIESFIANLLD